MPFPSTRVIPLRWSEHHQPVAAGAMTATCQITDPTQEVPGVFDPATGTTSAPTPFVIYDGPARVQEYMRANNTMQAGQDVTERRYLIAITAAAPSIQQGWPVLVTAAPNDAQLAGQTLYVADVQLGSERFQRNLICTMNQG